MRFSREVLKCALEGHSGKSRGRVMKNVTGLDLARTICGSWGTLAVMSEVTFKVMPRPEQSASLVLFGLEDSIAIEALTAAMASPTRSHIQGAVSGSRSVRYGTVDSALLMTSTASSLGIRLRPFRLQRGVSMNPDCAAKSTR